MRELRLRLDAMHVADRAEAKIIKERLSHAEADLDLTRRRADDLVVRSPAAGRFYLPKPQDLPGRFLRRGAVLAYITDPGNPAVRVLIPQDVVDIIRHRTQGIEVRFAGRIGEVYRAKVERAVPAASTRLPNLAFSTQGGGEIALDPEVADSGMALDSFFQFELSLEEAVELPGIGGRAYVRFDHGSEPLAWRLYRNLRQLFLRQFHV